MQIVPEYAFILVGLLISRCITLESKTNKKSSNISKYSSKVKVGALSRALGGTLDAV